MRESPQYREGRNLAEIRSKRIHDSFGLKSESTCRTAHADEASCNADDKCAWCKSAAVPSACLAIDDAKALPASVFDCAKMTEPLEEPEDDKQPKYVEMLKNAFRDFHPMKAHKSEATKPAKHHTLGMHPLPLKHPWSSPQKKHCSAACVAKVLLVALVAFHLWTIHKLAKTQEDYLSQGGSLKAKAGKKKGTATKVKKAKKAKKAKKTKAQTAPLVMDYSICEHDFKDKEEFPVVEAPQVHSAPASYIVERPAHQMM